MQKKFKFTNAKLKAIKPHDKDSPSTELELSDDSDVSGLKLLVGKSGSKRFLLRYTFKSRKRSIAIGKFGDIDVATARRIAQKHKSLIAEGIDPKVEKDSYKTMPTLSEFFNNTYLPVIKPRRKSWDKDVERFNRFIEPRLGNIRLQDLTSMDVLHLQQTIANPKKMKRDYAPSTNNRVIAVLKTMCNYALKMGVITSNAALPVSLLREDNIRDKFFDIEQTKKIIESALNYQNVYIGAGIAILYLTGNRRSEIFKLKWSDLDKENRTAYVPDSKNGKPFTIYLSKRAYDIIINLKPVAGNPYIFAGRVKGKPISSVRTAYRYILEGAGITDFEGVCFHTARHSVASNMISSGKFSQVHVKQQLAHRSIQSSERYIKHTPASARNISQGFADLMD